MKKFNRILALLLVVSLTYSCGNADAPSENENVEVSTENLTVADYTVEGMVCAMGCAGTIQEEVAGMTGVVVSTVDYEAGKAHFEFDEGIVSEKEIIAKIEGIADGQYKVSELSEVSAEEEMVEENNSEDLIEVSLPSFEIPNLFTLLLDQV